jgi:RNA exonuclease 4
MSHFPYQQHAAPYDQQSLKFGQQRPSGDSESSSSDSSHSSYENKQKYSTYNAPQGGNGRQDRRRRVQPMKEQNQPHTTTRTHWTPKRAPKQIPSWLPEQCVALDAEMVGVGMGGQNSSVARVTVIDWHGRVLFDEHIQQQQPVTDYRTFVSGVTEEHLQNAKMTFLDARTEILRILYGRFLIGHALKNDLTALGISHPWWLIRDTAKYEPFMQTIGGDHTLWPRKLKNLAAEKLNQEIQVYGKPHCPKEDALAALNLYKSVRPAWEHEMQKDLDKSKRERTKQFKKDKRMMFQQRHLQWVQQQEQWASQRAQYQLMMWQQHGQLVQ